MPMLTWRRAAAAPSPVRQKGCCFSASLSPAMSGPIEANGVGAYLENMRLLPSGWLSGGFFPVTARLRAPGCAPGSGQTRPSRLGHPAARAVPVGPVSDGKWRRLLLGHRTLCQQLWGGVARARGIARALTRSGARALTRALSGGLEARRRAHKGIAPARGHRRA
jgi:hypothetical protein